MKKCKVTSNGSSLPSRVKIVLLAFAEAFIPELPPPNDVKIQNDNPNENGKLRFWNYSIVQDDAFVAYLTNLVYNDNAITSIERWALFFLLYILSSTIGSILFFGRWKPFHQWSVPERVKALQTWRDSPLTIWHSWKRELFATIKDLVCFVIFSYTVEDEALDANLRNPFWEGMEYQGPIHKYDKNDQEKVKNGLVYDFIKEKSILNHDEICQQQDPMQFDVVIIGSGAGGGVASAILAEAGFSVLILEKGSYIPPDDIQNLEGDSLISMYERAGCLRTSNSSIAILAGSTVGGGTEVNWGCCLELPSYVKEEWANKYGLNQFLSSDFTDSLKAIKNRISCRPLKDAVSPGSQIHNNPNTLLYNMCKNEDYKVYSAETNFLHPDWDSAGYTGCGDRYKNKQGGTVTFLADAARCGAKILDQANVIRILRDGKRANGVEVMVKCKNGKQVKKNILAKRCVICSGGSLNSPCVLQRSKFKNKNIGKYLFLHPTTGLCASFGNDYKPKNGVQNHNESENEWEKCVRTNQVKVDSNLSPGHLQPTHGAPLTTICHEFHRGLNDDGYGPKLEVPCFQPTLLGALTPWMDPCTYRNIIQDALRSLGIIVLQRDSGEGGRVFDQNGLPCIEYMLSETDEENMLWGLTKSIEMCAKNGAKAITAFQNIDPLKFTGEENKDKLLLTEYIEKVKKTRLRNFSATLGSAHQMGSCRMGITPEKSVVDENGKLWESDNVYVIDASVFPTASGVNPMLTNLTISHMLSTRLARRLHLETSQE